MPIGSSSVPVNGTLPSFSTVSMVARSAVSILIAAFDDDTCTAGTSGNRFGSV